MVGGLGTIISWRALASPLACGPVGPLQPSCHTLFSLGGLAFRSFGENLA